MVFAVHWLGMETVDSYKPEDSRQLIACNIIANFHVATNSIIFTRANNYFFYTPDHLGSNLQSFHHNPHS